MTNLLDRLNVAFADRYSIERELGRGGMAIVYLATDLSFDPVRHDRRFIDSTNRMQLPKDAARR